MFFSISFFFSFNRAISELSLCFMPVRCVQAGQLLQILSPNFCFQWTSATVKKLGHPGTWIFCLTRLFWKNKVIQFLAQSTLISFSVWLSKTLFCGSAGKNIVRLIVEKIPSMLSENRYWRSCLRILMIFKKVLKLLSCLVKLSSQLLRVRYFKVDLRFGKTISFLFLGASLILCL